MLKVTAIRFVKRPRPSHQTMEVKLYGFDRLTPRAARAALEIAFGNANEGTVWADGYGYRVYEKSARKVVFGEGEGPYR